MSSLARSLTRGFAQPLSCLAVAAALAGCAGTPPADTAAPLPKPAAAPQPAATAPAPAVPAAAPPMAARNPVVIEFPARSVLLTEEGRDLLPQLIARAKAAPQLVVMGFCDKAQAANAREIAIGRGIAVRNELVRLGVPAAKLRVRYTTTEPGRHAVELSFDEPGMALPK